MDSYIRLKGPGLNLLVYQDHSEMGIRQTSRTPFVWFTKKGELTISGRLTHEHSYEFLHIIEEWMEETGAWNQKDLKVHLDLEHQTASACQTLYKLLVRMGVRSWKMEVDWHYPVDDPCMLDLGQILDELLAANFHFFPVNRVPDPLDRLYRKCLMDREALFERILKDIMSINESCKNLNLSWLDINDGILKKIKRKHYRMKIREIITMKSKFLDLNRQLDQYRLSVMNRDINEGRELNEDIRKWWGNRY